MNKPETGDTGKNIQKLLAGLTLTDKRNLLKLLSSRYGRELDILTRRQWLVAFVTMPSRETAQSTADDSAGNQRLSVAQLRQWLADKLPGYAIPAKIYTLESIPRLASGKVDKARLKDLAITLLDKEHDPEAPSQASPADILSTREIEIYRALKTTWEKVLGCAVTGPGDHFFELGGDSILSIHMVSGMLKAGYKIGPNDVFDFPEIGSLAKKLAVKNEPEEPALQQASVNHADLTPIQSWFFSTITAQPGQWNMARLYKLPQAVDDARVQQALDSLAKKHDVFRIGFEHRAGKYRQVLCDSTLVSLEIVPIKSKLLSAEELERRAGMYRSPFRLERAPLIRFVLFKTDTDRLLLVTAHHLVMDIISWQILKRDLEYFLHPADSGGRAAVPVPFVAWADYQARLADQPVVEKQTGFWRASCSRESAVFPFRHLRHSLGGYTSTESAVETLETRLDAHDSHALKREVHHGYQTTVPDLLLSAFWLAVHEQFGCTQIIIDVEGHGRFDPLENFDLSATIGWFSVIYPLLLTSHSGTVSQYEQIDQTIKATKEKLRQVSHGGITFGLLRQAGQLKQLDSLPQSRILFNYMGSADLAAADKVGEFELSEIDIDIPGQRHPANQRSHFVEIITGFRHGQLYIHWRYDSELLNGSELAEFAGCYERILRNIISHCRNQQSGGYTPSDFPDAGLDQDELDEFLESLD